MLYVAYGSNINKDQMKYRVPGAKPYGVGTVFNWQLAFHGNDGTAYATIVQSPGKCVPVVIWEMSDKQEAVMDRFEGYPNSYYKKKIPVHVDGKKLVGTVYIMNPQRRVARPSRKYVNTVRIGYESFGIDVSYLQDALERNSKEYYLDDLMEVREFKPFVQKYSVVKKPAKQSGKSNSKNKGKKKIVTETFSWKQHPDVPSDLAGYMRKVFPDDPYWGPSYGYDDDYHEYTTGSRKPSLDDYDYYGGK